VKKADANTLWKLTWVKDGKEETARVRGGAPAGHAEVIRRSGGEVTKILRVED
jgi:hypothetical protein